MPVRPGAVRGMGMGFGGTPRTTPQWTELRCPAAALPCAGTCCGRLPSLKASALSMESAIAGCGSARKAYHMQEKRKATDTGGVHMKVVGNHTRNRRSENWSSRELQRFDPSAVAARDASEKSGRRGGGLAMLPLMAPVVAACFAVAVFAALLVIDAFDGPADSRQGPISRMIEHWCTSALNGIASFVASVDPGNALSKAYLAANPEKSPDFGDTQVTYLVLGTPLGILLLLLLLFVMYCVIALVPFALSLRHHWVRRHSFRTYMDMLAAPVRAWFAVMPLACVGVVAGLAAMIVGGIAFLLLIPVGGPAIVQDIWIRWGNQYGHGYVFGGTRGMGAFALLVGLVVIVFVAGVVIAGLSWFILTLPVSLFVLGWMQSHGVFSSAHTLGPVPIWVPMWLGASLVITLPCAFIAAMVVFSRRNDEPSMVLAEAFSRVGLGMSLSLDPDEALEYGDRNSWRDRRFERARWARDGLSRWRIDDISQIEGFPRARQVAVLRQMADDGNPHLADVMHSLADDLVVQAAYRDCLGLRLYTVDGKMLACFMMIGGELPAPNSPAPEGIREWIDACPIMDYRWRAPRDAQPLYEFDADLTRRLLEQAQGDDDGRSR